MFSNKRPWILALLVAGLVARAGYSWKYPQWGPGGTIPDISWYETMAESLLHHGELRDPSGNLNAAREPGYPLILAGLYNVTGPSYRAAQALNALLGILTIALIFALGRDVFGPQVGLLGAAIAAFYPQFVYYSASLEREIFQTFLITAAVWLLVRAHRDRSLRLYAAAGAATACCALTNSVFIPAGAALTLGVWLSEPRPRRGRWTAVYLAAMLAVYAPWPLRNYLVFGRPIIGSSAGGAHLYIGLIVPNDVAGTTGEPELIGKDPVAQEASKLGEAERDALFYREALKIIRREPVRFARYISGSFLKLWRLYPYERAYAHGSRQVFWVSLLSDGWIIPFTLLGMLLARRRFPYADLFYLVLASVSGVYTVFWSIIRYRLPMMPFAILFCAYGLQESWKRAQRTIS